ncbi:tRNA (guanosine(37)-N1)-methyltransferase TrmD [Tepidimonas taiwanensis]|uniref:tRNA (guanine-N(1)-)-methyltransferase n=1 Tax=Tepidimonas taiwanensis TaxID=307486 RepID=A0A554X532_9BURK|nr:tRNA (guanosine(37)-N1)-methyltransferase TrmD [Tepidimonas taiwanensis]TSE30935.1 tRNA (guanine-N(1)-)-methyltransferase [Tepidimonas taiwanensis]UBQ05853.1 tRNA (guanosine(37)-N1)-methyltransferase TrmD [Tepidimonas taiwanensis]
MRFDIITLFPELIEPYLSAGVTRRAFAGGAVTVRLWPLRDHADGHYRRVDDRPFGGGPGMVMMAEPLYRCWRAIRVDRGLDAVRAPGAPVDVPTVLFSPAGERLTHAVVARYAAADAPGAILVCGRYEGVDQRFIDACVDAQISLGDFVLSGGEIAAVALLDAVARLQPGVLGDAASAEQDSFNPAVDGLLDCPHYTRPEVWEGPHGPAGVPPVLLSGHHGQIASWRRAQRLLATARARPDLLAEARARGVVTPADERWLGEAGYNEKL